MSKSALIAGITGQDGAYLAHYLLGMGYKVVGTSRDAQACDTSRLERLGIADNITLLSLTPNNFQSVLRIVADISPDEIYNLSGQTSVGLSFEQPIECMDSIFVGTVNFLEAVRFTGGKARFFSAGSSECFGNVGGTPAKETTPMKPQSPYAVAKAAAYWQTSTYRQAYNIFACTGILANHESPLRPRRFVTQKVIDGVLAIKNGQQSVIELGNLDIWRDWGWAPDYVKAMHLMLQADKPKDYLIASGKTTSLREFVRSAFEALDLSMEDHIESVDKHRRPCDLDYSALDPSMIENDLGWKSRRPIQQIVEKMLGNSLF